MILDLMATEYLRSERLVYRHIAGEHLLIDLRSKSEVPFFALTESAIPLWNALATWSSVERLAQQLREEYEIPEEEAVADVREFLDQLTTLGGVSTREATQ